MISKSAVCRFLFVILWGGLAGCALGTSSTTMPQPLPTVALPNTVVSPVFDGARAYRDVEYQVSLGPRVPGSPGHTDVIVWMVGELEGAGWEATVQEGEYLGFPIRNVIAKRAGASDGGVPTVPIGDPSAEWIILGAHFDTRSRADQDPDPARWGDPVPGANDGASGVAVLLELARVLPVDLDKNVWLVFFDAEDDGRIEGREWIMGSSYFVEQLTADENAVLPEAAVIVDMIGDADLDIYLEMNSDPVLSGEIWGVAEMLGYQDAILSIPRHRMLDDHIPFKNAGIPAVDMIDFDYPYWHTVGDTVDKVSGQSLKIVGDTLLKWLLQR